MGTMILICGFVWTPRERVAFQMWYEDQFGSEPNLTMRAFARA